MQYILLSLIIIRLVVNKVTIKLLNLIMVIKLRHVNEEDFMLKVFKFLPHLIVNLKLTLNYEKHLMGVA